MTALTCRRLPLACILGGAVLLSLACGGLSEPECVGSVVYNGQTFTPESGVSDPDEAQRNACNMYCRDADPEYEAMYGIWQDSPQGNPSISKQEAIFESDSLMTYVTETCANRCVSDIASGAMQGSVTCE